MHHATAWRWETTLAGLPFFVKLLFRPADTVFSIIDILGGIEVLTFSLILVMTTFVALIEKESFDISNQNDADMFHILLIGIISIGFIMALTSFHPNEWWLVVSGIGSSTGAYYACTQVRKLYIWESEISEGE